MALSGSLPQINLGIQDETEGGLHRSNDDGTLRRLKSYNYHNNQSQSSLSQTREKSKNRRSSHAHNMSRIAATPLNRQSSSPRLPLAEGIACKDLNSNLSELNAISGVLDHALNSFKDSIWILTDSRTSIQYLKSCPKNMDSTNLDSLSKLVRLGQRKQVCLQWIPPHVGVPGKEATDKLAGNDVISLTPVPLS
ncbi:RNase H domain-containing protein [Trichonephila clavipes]|nr:RNase H domain-containing protein [Trichonephila clavipes]